ncbi:hypothetical protein PR202_ga03210 [Eleusine coracana subsp. coracana]|uniref:Uncharacterized protein n=1 Tax=Eleusine coracana subsp. coracana TaxID=191504 RepID=A0AAV5BMV6_ELECO|nr:hypothetical protein PR202_ga03210 [Eleusine coracana subsp. coracana]
MGSKLCQGQSISPRRDVQAQESEAGTTNLWQRKVEAPSGTPEASALAARRRPSRAPTGSTPASAPAHAASRCRCWTLSRVDSSTCVLPELSSRSDTACFAALPNAGIETSCVWRRPRGSRPQGLRAVRHDVETGGKGKATACAWPTRSLDAAAGQVRHEILRGGGVRVGDEVRRGVVAENGGGAAAKLCGGQDGE